MVATSPQYPAKDRGISEQRMAQINLDAIERRGA
jgi:hypothetical protein